MTLPVHTLNQEHNGYLLGHQYCTPTLHIRKWRLPQYAPHLTVPYKSTALIPYTE